MGIFACWALIDTFSYHQHLTLIMPRQSRSRPAARPAAPPPQKPQSRSASTTATPPVPAQAPPAPVPHPGATADAGKQPGMIAQMAATAGSVAIGSTIGHGLSSMLFGGSSAATTEPAQQPAAPPVQQQNQGISCDVQAKDFTRCLEAADVQSCSWYLEQLKACQAAARPY
ncbi:hypothetical protein JB92DRAFT_1166502 [Gautieria morchelliformis]|nr:hypothetical protein JB92DRAFT_1166502 [Gautieria morchelliformis]